MPRFEFGSPGSSGTGPPGGNDDGNNGRNTTMSGGGMMMTPSSVNTPTPNLLSSSFMGFTPSSQYPPNRNQQGRSPLSSSMSSSSSPYPSVPFGAGGFGSGSVGGGALGMMKRGGGGMLRSGIGNNYEDMLSPPSSSGIMPPQQQQVLMSSSRSPSGRSASAPATKTKSVCLSCLSSDGEWMHTFDVSKMYIDSHRLPLDRTEDVENNNARGGESHLIHTSLPEIIRSAVSIDPVMELFCTDVAGSSNKKNRNANDGDASNLNNNNNNNTKRLSRLCLYTTKNVFLIEIGYAVENGNGMTNDNNGIRSGCVISICEPFHRFLMDTSMMAASIIRVRPGPNPHQYRPGFSLLSSASSASANTIMCPPHCLAMLTINAVTNEYALSLFHGQGSGASISNNNNVAEADTTTTPLVFAVEELSDPKECIVDFCYGKSNSLSVFSALSVLLLKGTGDVMCASPIVFDGSLVTRASLLECIEYLQENVNRLDRASAQWRQCRVAQQYLMDVFLGGGLGSASGMIANTRSYFATARILDRGGEGFAVSDAASWLVQIQGPVRFETETDGSSFARTIECFGNTSVAGIALGRDHGQVDFLVVSPTALLPRFTLESNNDRYDLDEALYTKSALVARVLLEQGEEDTNPYRTSESELRCLSLIPDPTVDTLIHYVTGTSVATISTNAVRVTSRNLVEKSGTRGGTSNSTDTIRTTAWLSLSTPSSTPMQGVVTTITSANGGSSDGSQDEILVRLADGSIIPVNVTERQFLQEINEFWQDQQRQQLALVPSTGGSSLVGGSFSDTSASLRELESTKPLCEVMAPLMELIQTGLGGMCKIVGTQTHYKDITPDALAVALQVQERCNREVVDPLLELKRVVKKRRQKLLAMMQSQQEQLNDLLSTIDRLKRGMESICEQIETADANATLLSERSDRALQASRGLLPTITQAEYEFIRDMKRLDAKTEALEKDSQAVFQTVAKKKKELQQHSPKLQSKTSGTGNALTMDADKADKANAMLEASGITLATIEGDLAKAEKHLRRLAEPPIPTINRS